MFICDYCKSAETCKRTHNRAHECSRFEEDAIKHQELIKEAKRARARMYKLPAEFKAYLDALGGKSVKMEVLEND